MFLQFKNFTIRNAAVEDADLLSTWWNDGKIMAHAGFPKGLDESAYEIAESLKKDTDEYRRLIIEGKLKIPPESELRFVTFHCMTGDMEK